MRPLALVAFCLSSWANVYAQDERPLKPVSIPAQSLVPVKGASRNAFFIAGDVVIPYIIDSASATTRIVLQNLDAVPITVTLQFTRFDGSAWQLATTAAPPSASLTVDVPAGGTRLFETTGASTNALTGWALALYDPSANLAISTFLKYGQGSQAFDLPIATANPLAPRSLVNFDNRNGFSTRVWVVNTLNKGVTFTSTWRDANGESQGTIDYNLPAMSGGFASVADAFPDSAGQTGTIDISSASFGLAVQGWRFAPQGFYFFYPSVSSASWLPGQKE